eukprot:COSAG06_NODE_1424_length_9498_cov_12.066816_4_plen_120_part_00
MVSRLRVMAMHLLRVHTERSIGGQEHSLAMLYVFMGTNHLPRQAWEGIKTNLNVRSVCRRRVMDVIAMEGARRFPHTLRYLGQRKATKRSCLRCGHPDFTMTDRPVSRGGSATNASAEH